MGLCSFMCCAYSCYPCIEYLKTNEKSSNHASPPFTPHGVLSQDIVPAQLPSLAASPQRVQAPHMPPSQACSHLYALRIQAARQVAQLAQPALAHGEEVDGEEVDGKEVDGAELGRTAGIRSLLAMAKRA